MAQELEFIVNIPGDNSEATLESRRVIIKRELTRGVNEISNQLKLNVGTPRYIAADRTIVTRVVVDHDTPLSKEEVSRISGLLTGHIHSKIQYTLTHSVRPVNKNSDSLPRPLNGVSGDVVSIPRKVYEDLVAYMSIGTPADIRQEIGNANENRYSVSVGHKIFPPI